MQQEDWGHDSTILDHLAGWNFGGCSEILWCFGLPLFLDLKGSMKADGEGYPHKLWPTVEGAGLYTEHGRQSVDDGFQEHQKPLLLYPEFQPGTVGKHCSIREHPCTRRLQPDVLAKLCLQRSRPLYSEAPVFGCFLDGGNEVSRFYISLIVTIFSSR